jgi:hypothetical protein
MATSTWATGTVTPECTSIHQRDSYSSPGVDPAPTLANVADRESHRIQIFDPQGKYITQWNNMHRPCGLLIGGKEVQFCVIGSLRPALFYTENFPNLGPYISIYNLKGERLARLGDIRPGDEPNQFWAPHGIGMDSRGDMYIGEVSWTSVGCNMKPPKELRSFRKLVKST